MIKNIKDISTNLNYKDKMTIEEIKKAIMEYAIENGIVISNAEINAMATEIKKEESE